MSGHNSLRIVRIVLIIALIVIVIRNKPNIVVWYRFIDLENRMKNSKIKNGINQKQRKCNKMEKQT